MNTKQVICAGVFALCLGAWGCESPASSFEVTPSPSFGATPDDGQSMNDSFNRQPNPPRLSPDGTRFVSLQGKVDFRAAEGVAGQYGSNLQQTSGVEVWSISDEGRIAMVGTAPVNDEGRFTVALQGYRGMLVIAALDRSDRVTGFGFFEQEQQVGQVALVRIDAETSVETAVALELFRQGHGPGSYSPAHLRARIDGRVAKVVRDESLRVAGDAQVFVRRLTAAFWAGEVAVHRALRAQNLDPSRWVSDGAELSTLLEADRVLIDSGAAEADARYAMAISQLLERSGLLPKERELLSRVTQSVDGLMLGNSDEALKQAYLTAGARVAARITTQVGQAHFAIAAPAERIKLNGFDEALFAGLENADGSAAREEIWLGWRQSLLMGPGYGLIGSLFEGEDVSLPFADLMEAIEKSAAQRDQQLGSLTRLASSRGLLNESLLDAVEQAWVDHENRVRSRSVIEFSPQRFGRRESLWLAQVFVLASP